MVNDFGIEWNVRWSAKIPTAWKMCIYGVFSGPYILVFGPEKTPRAGNTAGDGGYAPPPPPPHPIFLRSKKKKAEQKKERISKQKLLKGCHQGQQVTVLAILERLEFKHFFSQPTTVADNTFYCSTLKSFSPALYFGLVSPYTFSSGKM